MKFHERGENVSLYLSGLNLIQEASSKFNKRIQLVRHKDLGKILILDGEVQHVEAWSPFYHEPIVHLPASFVRRVQNVLILGGGCFYTAREVLKYETVKKVIMVEHDQKVIDVISKNYKHARDILKDKRFHLEIGDAFKRLDMLTDKFDLVINDSVDLINFFKIKGTGMFAKFLSKVSTDGACSDLIYRHIFERSTTLKTLRVFEKSGINSAFSLVTVPEYPGILHLLAVWGANKNISQSLKSPINVVQQGWIGKSNPCEYFNPAFLRYYFYLPSYLKRITK